MSQNRYFLGVKLCEKLFLIKSTVLSFSVNPIGMPTNK